MNFLLDFFIQPLLPICMHKGKIGWPVTRNGITYCICDNCKQELPFDSKKFRLKTRQELRRESRQKARHDASLAANRYPQQFDGALPVCGTAVSLFCQH